MIFGQLPRLGKFAFASSDTRNGSRPYRTTRSVSDLYHERECMSTLSAQAGQPSPPDGGLAIESSGCRGRPGSSKSHPLALVTNTVDEYG
eukprot:9489531-Pyramimonas_sp.AAC.1